MVVAELVEGESGEKIEEVKDIVTGRFNNRTLFLYLYVRKRT